MRTLYRMAAGGIAENAGTFKPCSAERRRGAGATSTPHLLVLLSRLTRMHFGNTLAQGQVPLLIADIVLKGRLMG